MTARTINFILIMAAMALVALTIGSSALLRIAVSMLIMLILSLLSAVWGLMTAKVSFAADVKRIERGASAGYRMIARYTSFIPLGSLIFVSTDGRETVFEMLPYQAKNIKAIQTFKHRGVYTLGEGRVYAFDMFGLFALSKKVKAAGENIVVVPKKMEFDAPKIKTVDVGPETRRRFQDDASAPSGVRDWRDGDSLKRVHWKLTMKTYDPSLRNLRPMVRTYDEAARPDTVVLTDLSKIDAVEEWAKYAEDGVCEASYGAAYSLLEGENRVRMVLAGNTPMEVEGESAMEAEGFLDALANAAFDGREPFEQAIYESARHPERTGMVIAVTAKMTMRVVDALTRIGETTGIQMMAVWITDQRRADTDQMLSRLESSGVAARCINPFKAG
ncbi:MAG: DUF58 domain-containing protein [Clostridia bacterium]|nr:DUF58 domain-containing protein [Clostridia bacterium]